MAEQRTQTLRVGLPSDHGASAPSSRPFGFFSLALAHFFSTHRIDIGVRKSTRVPGVCVAMWNSPCQLLPSDLFGVPLQV